MKNYILDTNVLLHDPAALQGFADNNVLIPIEVIEEIDRFKRESSERGQNARAVSRMLDGFRSLGSLSEGVTLESGGRLRVIFKEGEIRNKVNGKRGSGARASSESQPGAATGGDSGHDSMSVHGNGNGHGHANGNGNGSVDSRIVALALVLKKRYPSVPAILVSKDINLRIKADALGLQAQDYQSGRVHIHDLYTGMFEMEVSAREIQSFRLDGELALPSGHRYTPNEYCMLREEGHAKRSLLAKVDSAAGKLIPIIDAREGVWGIKARNREQHFALDALLDERVRLVTLMGKAGTGKTLLAMAVGMKRTTQDREYRRLVVARPTIPMGKELGFLPGSLEEKLNPWMQPIHDALELLSDMNMGHDNRRSQDYLRSGTIVVEALSYIRGRSIAHQFMIIDEAQNLTPLEVKTIITRVGPGTKIVMTGDPYQIDNPYVDSASNGFNYLVSRFRGQPLFAHVELQKGERSELAEIAANLL